MSTSSDITDVSQAYAEMLMNALGSDDWRVRDGVAAELRDADIQLVTPQLVEMLTSENVGERNAAITALIKRGDKSLPALHRALEDPDADVRNFVALALGHIADRRSAEVLLEAFGVERDPNVQYHIVEALGRIGNVDSTPFLVSLFSEAEPCLAAAAIQACGTMRAAEATEALLSLVTDPTLGLVAVHALGDIRSPRALGPLVRLASVPGGSSALHGAVAEAAATIVEPMMRSHSKLADLLASQVRELQAPSLVRAVERVLDSGEAEPKWVLLACWLADPLLLPSVFRYGMEPTVCGEIAVFALSAAATPLVGTAALSADPVLRNAACRLVAEEPELGGPWMINLLCDDEPAVRVAALRAHVAMHGAAVTPALVEALSDPDERIRLAALEELDSLSDVDENLLVALSGDESPFIRAAALGLLARVSGEPLGSAALARLAEDPRPGVRAALARYLSAQSVSRQWETVCVLAGDESPVVRAAAAGAVVRFRHPDVPTLLVALLTDGEAEVRAATADALEQAPGDRPKALLPGLLDDNDPRVVISALGALGRAGLWTATAAVTERLGSENSDIRVAALRALDRIERHAAVDAAVRLALEDDSWNVRLAAVEVLQGARDQAVRKAVIGALDDVSPEVRGAAIEVLPGIMGPLTASYAARFLADNELHTHAISALCTVGEPAVDAIERFIATQPLAAAGPAARVLALIGGPHAMALLESLLWHRLAGVRWWVATTLVAYPQHELADAIRESLTAESDADVAAALQDAQSAARAAAGS